jgi:hypothetical protein
MYMSRRTGLPTINRVARELCRLITVFSPIIQRTYPNNPALLAALEAANAACAVLVAESTDAIPLGD